MEETLLFRVTQIYLRRDCWTRRVSQMKSKSSVYRNFRLSADTTQLIKLKRWCRISPTLRTLWTILKLKTVGAIKFWTLSFLARFWLLVIGHIKMPIHALFQDNLQESQILLLNFIDKNSQTDKWHGCTVMVMFNFKPITLRKIINQLSIVSKHLFFVFLIRKTCSRMLKYNKWQGWQIKILKILC